MTFDEILAQVIELLRHEQRVSYRALKRRFALDEDYLEDLKDEIIKAKRLACDEDGAVLVWIGAGAAEQQGPLPTTTRPCAAVVPAAGLHKFDAGDPRVRKKGRLSFLSLSLTSDRFSVLYFCAPDILIFCVYA